MKRKALIWIVVVSIIFGFTTLDLFAAGAEETVAKVETVTWLIYHKTAIAFGNPLQIYEWMEEIGNVKINPIPIPRDAYVSRLNTMIASGDLPDMFTPIQRWDDMKEYGPKGLFLPLSDYWEFMPEVKEKLEMFPVDAKLLESSDGKMYVAPFVSLYASGGWGIIIRGDLLEQGGMKLSDIKTTDDLTRAVRILKEQNGGIPPWSSRAGMHGLTRFAKIFGTDVSVFPYFDVEQDKYVNQLKLDRTRGAIEYFAQWQKEGLFDPEWLIMKEREWETRHWQGEYSFAPEHLNRGPQFVDGLKAAEVAGAKVSAILPPSYNGKHYKYPESIQQLRGSSGTAVSAKTKAKEGIFKILDSWWDEEQIDLWRFGIEGVTFERRADGSARFIEDVPWSEEYRKTVMDVVGAGGDSNFSKLHNESVFFNWRMPNNVPGESWFEKALELYNEADIYVYVNAKRSSQRKNMRRS